MVNTTSRVSLYIGSERFLKERSLKKLKASLSSPQEEVEYSTFYLSESGLSHVIGSISGLALFSSKKLIILKEFDSLPKDERQKLVSFLNDIPKSTTVVVDSEDEKSVSEIIEKVKDANIARFSSPSEDQLASWITRYLASSGKKIDLGALESLKESRKTDLEAISRELDKLISYAGLKDTVTAEDVAKLVGKSVVESAFELGWAIGDRDAGKALSISRQLVSGGQRPHEVVGLIAWHLNRLVKAKTLESIGVNTYGISSALKLGMKYQGRFFKQLKGSSLAKLRKKIDLLVETDVEIKRTRFDPVLLLETAILRLSLS